MKKPVLFLLFGMLSIMQLSAQKNEYQYIALKFGASHGLFPKPEFNQYKYLMTPGNEEMVLNPKGPAYAPGFVFDFLYHFDFTSDNAGVYTGLEYNLGGLGTNYTTNYGGYTLKQVYRYHSVGLPVGFKYGPNMWKKQTYVFAGAQLNYIITMSAVDKVDWQKSPSSVKLSSEEYNKTVFNIFFGVNYAAFNLQFDFYPKSFFNKTYVSPAGIKIHSTEPDKAFALKTTINIPYGWLSEKSFWWRKKLRDLPWK